jgi:hypothetical protein
MESAINSASDDRKYATKMVLLTVYSKLANIYLDELLGPVKEVFQNETRHPSQEMAQRACEYLALLELNNLDVLGATFEPMPPWPEHTVGFSHPSQEISPFNFLFSLFAIKLSATAHRHS